MYLPWLSYWFTYFVMGLWFNDDSKRKVPYYQLYSVLGLNMFIFKNRLQNHLIQLPNHWSNVVRWVLALILSDTMVYWTHRLFHTHLYQFHKIHHIYQAS